MLVSGVWSAGTRPTEPKDADVILCFVHPALLCWKVILFTDESGVLSLGNAITSRLLLAIVRSWALADVRE